MKNEDDELSVMFATLTGKKKHYCPDWDYLPIDETCEEFKACGCVFIEEAK